MNPSRRGKDDVVLRDDVLFLLLADEDFDGSFSHKKGCVTVGMVMALIPSPGGMMVLPMVIVFVPVVDSSTPHAIMRGGSYLVSLSTLSVLMILGSSFAILFSSSFVY